MQLIGAALGNYLDLRTAEPPVLRVVAVRDNLQFSDRIFTGSDHGGAAPDGAHRAYAVDGDAIGFVLATCILDLETTAPAAGAGSLVPRQLEASAAALLRSISKNARRQLGQLKDIAIER